LEKGPSFAGDFELSVDANEERFQGSDSNQELLSETPGSLDAIESVWILPVKSGSSAAVDPFVNEFMNEFRLSFSVPGETLSREHSPAEEWGRTSGAGDPFSIFLKSAEFTPASTLSARFPAGVSPLTTPGYPGVPFAPNAEFLAYLGTPHSEETVLADPEVSAFLEATAGASRPAATPSPSPENIRFEESMEAPPS